MVTLDILDLVALPRLEYPPRMLASAACNSVVHEKRRLRQLRPVWTVQPGLVGDKQTLQTLYQQ
jgi:hypothetical protein